MRPHSNDSQVQGFTLIELLVVLAIMSVLTASLTPYLSQRQGNASLRKTLIDIQGALDKARIKAVQTDSEQVVRFNLSPVQNYVSGTRTQAIPARVKLSMPLTPNASRSDIRFYPDGSASGGVLSLSDGKSSHQITVQSFSGKVVVHD